MNWWKNLVSFVMTVIAGGKAKQSIAVGVKLPKFSVSDDVSVFGRTDKVTLSATGEDDNIMLTCGAVADVAPVNTNAQAAPPAKAGSAQTAEGAVIPNAQQSPTSTADPNKSPLKVIPVTTIPSPVAGDPELLFSCDGEHVLLEESGEQVEADASQARQLVNLLNEAIG
jgi:hypothetical protein